MLLRLREASGPLYRRVYLALKAKIRAGGLGPASKVPSTRARDLGVSNDVRPRELGALIARAARAGVGIHSVAPYYVEPPRRAGLLFGYAALTEGDIRAGVSRLAELFQARHLPRA